MRRFLVLIAALSLGAMLCAGGNGMCANTRSAMTEPMGIDSLFDIDRLPVLRESRVGMVSSYSRDTCNDDYRPHYLSIEDSGAPAKDLVFYTWAEGGRVDDIPADARCAAGEWRHVAVTWEISDDGKLSKVVYLDGELVKRRTVDGWRPALERAKGDDGGILRIGSQVNACWLNGALDDVRVYDHPLSDREIADLKSRGRGPSKGLVPVLDTGTEALKPGPGGRGLEFPDRAAITHEVDASALARRGTFAAWVNPSRLVKDQLQHVFCLGNDLMGLYLKAETLGKAGVLADLKGPGCIDRVWLGGIGGRTLHFYFDGEKEPRVSLRFSGAHGEPAFGAAKWIPLTSGAGDLCYPPMMATGAGDNPALETGVCYMPMSFAKSCKITAEPAGDKYLQVNYTLYPPETQVTTFDPHHISAAEIEQIDRGRKRWWNPTPCEPAEGIRARESASEIVLSPGKTAEVCRLAGAGRITALRVRIPEELRTEEVLRGLRLRIYWDGRPEPAVDTALGPFFNDAYGTPSADRPVPLSADIAGGVPNPAERAQWAFGLPDEYRNLLFGYTKDQGYYCYFPMPYAAGARIEIENGASREAKIGVSALHEAWPEAPSGLGRFHARYNRENPTQGIEDPADVRVDRSGKENYLIVESEGRGHFVGCSFFMRKARPIKPEVDRLVGEICEGNEMIFVDDDPSLTLIGTGTEDYINQNFWVHDHIYPYDGNRLSYDTCYRLHISDCVPFRKRIRVTTEHGAANAHYIDYSSVAYWYQEN